MVKDLMRLMAVMILETVGYNYDLLAQRIEMSIAIYGAIPLLPFYPIVEYINNIF